MGLDESWCPEKDMHALYSVVVTLDMSHGAMGWLKACPRIV